MRSVPSILFALIISATGISWLLYEEEIREFIGWPVVEEVEEGDYESSREPVDRKPAPKKEATEEKGPTEEEIIQRIVQLRYPDIPIVAFSDKFTDLIEIPQAAYPDRVKIGKPTSFSERRGNSVLAASRVKAGGWVRPEEIRDDGTLVVSSLAYPKMTTEVSMSDTDFLEVIEQKYRRSLEAAQERVITMREADASEIRSNSRLFRFLRDADSVWSEADSPGSAKLIDSLFQVLDPEIYSVSAFYESGRMRVQRGNHVGIFEVTHFLIEGTDQGFGPYYWGVRRLEQGGRVVDWLGLPE